MIDTALLHSRIAGAAPDYLREIFGEDVKRAGTDKWRVGRRGSMAISIRDGVLVFYSHEDGAGGDAVGLWQRQRGGSAGEALKAAATWANVPDADAPKGKTRRAKSPAVEGRRRCVERVMANLAPQVAPASGPALPSSASPVTTSRPVTGEPPRMLEAEFEEAFAMVKRLAYDEALCERIAKKRGWRAETVRGLTGDGALGWSDGWAGRHTGALAFCYESGIKHRWRAGAERVIRWYRGGPRTLWRGWMRLDQKEVWIMEGETDAISMINTGIEATLETLVVALPNAGVIPYGLAELVEGRAVVLSLDRDKAGEAATQKIAAIVRPVAESVRIRAWQWRIPKR